MLLHNISFTEDDGLTWRLHCMAMTSTRLLHQYVSSHSQCSGNSACINENIGGNQHCCEEANFCMSVQNRQWPDLGLMLLSRL